MLPFISYVYPSFKHLTTLFNESSYRIVPIKSQYEKAKNIKQTDAHIGRHQKYVVHPKLGVTSTNLLHHVDYFQNAGYNQDNSVAYTSLVYIARTPHGVFLYPYHWVQ